MKNIIIKFEFNVNMLILMWYYWINSFSVFADDNCNNFRQKFAEEQYDSPDIAAILEGNLGKSIWTYSLKS